MDSVYIGAAQAALWATALAAAPLLLPVLAVGLVVGIVQTATSINETTLSFVPKLIVLALVLALFGAAIMGIVVDFTRAEFARIAQVTR